MVEIAGITKEATKWGLYKFLFINDTVGWLCGTYQIVTKTTDGGLSWQTLSNQTSGAMHYFDIEFANENTGYVAGYNWDTPSQPVLKRSDDGGHTWFEIVLPADVYKLKDIFVFSPDELWIAVGNASFSPENNGFIAKAYHSTDGGINWENHELGICHSSAGLNRIRFDDPIHGWALSESHLFITDDGGQNWESKPMTSSMWMSMQDGCHPHDSVFLLLVPCRKSSNLLTMEQHGTLKPAGLKDILTISGFQMILMVFMWIRF